MAEPGSPPSTPRPPSIASDQPAMVWKSPRQLACLALLVLVTVLVYAPGLSGVFVFDDFPNIVDNSLLHVTTNDLASWLQAAWSSPASEFHRPLSSLSFALNFYFGGIDPTPMKVVNLAIHVVNGCLIFVLLQLLVETAAAGQAAQAGHRNDVPKPRRLRRQWLVFAVTAAWILHPINVTAVLYVVQRMESLAQVFVLMGLLFYASARRRQIAGGNAGWQLWAGVPLSTLLGVAAKESAALLPLYALLMEVVFQTCSPRTLRPKKELFAFFGIFLALPAIAGLGAILPAVLSPAAWMTRSFTLPQRLLTEARVVVDYAGWILWPLPGSFSLYHDDFAISRGLWDPWTTAAAIAFLIMLAGAAVAARRQRPLFSLGVGWFLAAQLLTATVIPLELMFEHRNYFASLGLLLAAFDLLIPVSDNARLPLVRNSAAVIFAALCAASTFLRAEDWSHPVRLGMAEVAAHPLSARANYELGRALVVLSGYRADSPAVAQARVVLERAADVAGSSAQPDAALLVLAARTGTPIEQHWWTRLQGKVRAKPLSVSDAAAMGFLAQCDKERVCDWDRNELSRTFSSAVSHETRNAAVLYAYAVFAYNGLDDPSLALNLARQAVDAAPRTPQYRINLAGFLVDLGRLDEAAGEIEVLRAHDPLGASRTQIERLEGLLKSRRTSTTDSTDTTP